jgi:hypothetical protein
MKALFSVGMMQITSSPTPWDAYEQSRRRVELAAGDDSLLRASAGSMAGLLKMAAQMRSGQLDRFE